MTNTESLAPAAYAATVYAPSVMLDDRLAPIDAVRDADGLLYSTPRPPVTVDVVSRTEDTVQLAAHRGAEQVRLFRLTRTAIGHEGGRFVSWMLGVNIAGLAGVYAAITYVATPADGANAVVAFLNAGPGPDNGMQAATYAGGIKGAWARFEASLNAA